MLPIYSKSSMRLALHACGFMQNRSLKNRRGTMLVKSGITRRNFIKTAITAVGATALPFGELAAQSRAKYRRYNVESEDGRKALASYSKGVQAMLSLPPDDPRNWFRNAFVHLMDCPHGNWWFYVWHRGFIGYFEQT